MRSRAFGYPRRTAGSDEKQSVLQTSSVSGLLARGLRSTLVVGLALLLVPLSEGDLFAQQAPSNQNYPNQSYPDQSYPNQSYPDQGYSDYGQQQDSQRQQQQPYYGQQQSYPQQQPYPQQAYPTQQPAYPQQQPYAPEQANPQQQQPMYPDEAQDYPPQGYGQTPAPPDYGQDQAQNYPQPQYAPQQPLSADQLQQLVAPIALYPDGLLAQVLAAATYPLQITEANQWRQAQGNAPPEQIAAGANAQDWDPSVKALTAFPDVLAQMAQNLQWTTALGNAYYNQPQDVLNTLQSLRQRAMAAGTLQNTPQETVTQNQGYVELAPPSPQVVYVPQYNPWAVYGAPIAPYPGYSVGAAIGSFVAGAVVGAIAAPVVFGVGMVMTAFAHMAWGFLGWGLGWGSGALFYHGAGYCTHSWTVRDWGLAHGGPRYFGRFEMARGGYGRGGAYGRGGYYSRGGEGYGRGPAGYGQAARGYAANRGAEAFRGGQYGGAYGRTTQAYNHMPTFNARGSYGRPAGSYGSAYNANRSGAYGRPASSYGSASYGRLGSGYSAYGRTQSYGSAGYGRTLQSYNGAGMMGRSYGTTARGGYSYGAQSYRGSAQNYRASAGSFGRGGFGGYSASSGRSSGFFGGGHSSGSFGGHSGGGSHFSGGGHFSSGGGGHFSNHGGGGHSGGGHGGGGHHR